MDAVAIATSAAHGAAVNLVLALDQPLGDADCWPSLGVPRLANDERDAIGLLGAYVCGKAEPPAGETLWRRACELGLTGYSAETWPHMPVGHQLAYELFAVTAAASYKRLAALPPADPPAPVPTPTPKLEDTIFEPLEGLADQDPDRVAALEAAGAPEPPAASEEPILQIGLDGVAGDGEVLAIGESGAQPRPKRHGGKRTKGEAKAATTA